jgi:hypothetical protein
VATGPGGRAALCRRHRTTRQRRADRQAGGLQRRRLVPADAATRRRRWKGVQPLDPQPEQPAGAATAGRRRRLRRQRWRRLHGVLPPFGHVERCVFSLVYVCLWTNSNILRVRPIYVRTCLYILNISKFCLSLNVFRLLMFEFNFSPGLATGKMGLPRPNFTAIRR